MPKIFVIDPLGYFEQSVKASLLVGKEENMEKE